MNPYISAALAEMDKVVISKLEYPGEEGGHRSCGVPALDQCSCRFLAAFIRATGARKVLEFGSGFSSLMIAREIGALEGNYLLSIDSSPRCSSMAREICEISGSQARVEFRVAGLRPKVYGSRLLLSYDLPKGLLEALGPFDLAFIDAPPYDYGREAVFYDSFPAVSPGGYIILDDANREDVEKANVRAWQAAYGDAIRPVLLEGIGNGLNVIEKFEDVRTVPFTSADSFLTSLKTLRSMSRLLLERLQAVVIDGN
ncbi:MAG: hypothetical protein A2X34_04815 [Elusimicrobia bacterium GWC2_51_8]|nr:MAG: hypothetical protein A2X33_05570 [Elusimicrobia bacterium GWA2_51_34]OGR60410.1 MAG: hypothetical protein A2X34_04815 [Elusimicrobia bacterium GWC2_51_8]OGR86181.1 MAG: hypothetical protein A2021_06075 [Elusimicrobia bacterium GWF2_52_66]HAF94827.1 hypothetical protein [Elusimicrobiota bacterium]HCE96955.1 hypothetical protein [Elusimicrobiota bacterium]